jgi:hypothetical protein
MDKKEEEEGAREEERAAAMTMATMIITLITAISLVMAAAAAAAAAAAVGSVWVVVRYRACCDMINRSLCTWSIESEGTRSIYNTITTAITVTGSSMLS